MKILHVAACDKEGGIYRFEITPDGRLIKKGFTPMELPMYMVEKKGKMHILLRQPFPCSTESGYLSYKIESDGSLSDPSDIVSTGGEVACHILATDEGVYAVNYVSGSVSEIGVKVITHTGSGPHPVRQTSPHTHFVGSSPDGRFLLVTDLGTDSVYVYDENLKEISRFSVPSGHGARHLVFSDDGKYCFVVNELISSVSVFRYNRGEFALLQTVSSLPDDFNDFNLAAAIRFSRNRVYVSNRGHNSIAVYDFQSEKLSLSGIYPCGGNYPRDFILADDFIVCTNERGNSVTVLDKRDMRVLHTEENVPSPLCAIITE